MSGYETFTREHHLLRALRIIALTNEERAISFRNQHLEELHWFVRNIDDLAPELHARGWVEHVVFDRQPGSVVVTDGQGDLRRVEITDLGRKQLNAAVSA